MFSVKELPTQTSLGKLHDKQQIRMSTHVCDFKRDLQVDIPTARFFKSMSKLKDLLRERLAADIPAKAKNGQGKGP